MSTPDKTDRIQTLISRLSGTCDSMGTVCEDLDLSDLDEDVTTEVDQQIFCCTQCSWWCEIDEEASKEVDHDELICTDCAYTIKQERGD